MKTNITTLAACLFLCALCSLATQGADTVRATGAPFYYRPVKAQAPSEIDCEVAVYGGTPAGVTAAIEAARLGRKTLLLSFNRHVGGMTSGGLTDTDVGKRESIGGLALEFYDRLGSIRKFSPSVAEALYLKMLAEAGVTVRLEQPLESVMVRSNRIVSATLLTGVIVKAAVFVDATYEGDLMAAAGVSYQVGREPRSAFGESLAGQWQQISWKTVYQFCGLPVSPYVVAGDPSSGLLPEISAHKAGAPGEGDYRVQAFNFRMYLSDKEGRIPFPKPAGYDPVRYGLLARFLNADPRIQWTLNYTTQPLTDGPVQMRNGDSNNAGSFSSDYVGGNYRWPDGTFEPLSFSNLPPARRGLTLPLRELYELRERIFQDHVAYQQGLLYFLANDPQVPKELQERAQRFGLDPDEFKETGYWPHQLYVREARRMVSDYVMTQAECEAKRVAKDSVGLASYPMDSHFCQRVVVEVNGKTTVRNEGGFGHACAKPYPISYRAIVPKREECANLLVPVCLSASHAAYGSIRMEPVFMILGQSAGAAASLAIDAGGSVQDVDYGKLRQRLLANKQRLSDEVQSYEQLVQERLREGLDTIARNHGMISKQENIGRDIYKSLLLFNENKNIAEAEKYIVNFCGNPLTTYVGKPVPQNRSEAMFRIYLTEKTRCLLSPKAKAVMEDYAWELLTQYNRGITRADADKPFWSFSSSENHYVNDRRRYLQALQIVRMSERYGPMHKLGEETIESHYQAWTKFWIRYFEVRAGQGTDMEIAHPSSYGSCTVGVYYDLHDLTDSPRLRELAGKFLTLYWAEVAAEFEPRTGQRAIAATRNPFYDGVRTYWAQSLLYCYGWSDGGKNDFSLDDLMFFLSSYRPPEILCAIAHDLKRGPYLATSRRALLIESEEKEKSGVIVFDKNNDGHFRRDVFYTPDYILSTMTLDPSRKYCGVGDLAQTMGVTFASHVYDRIVVMGTGFYAKRAINGITGKGVSVIARDPNAQVGRGRFMSEGTRVFIRKGTLWDNRVEDASGWLFTRAGDAYAAVRVAQGYTITNRTYIWPGRKLQEVKENHGHHLEFKDMWAPVVIQMSHAKDYKSFEAFQQSVKENKFVYQDNTLTYVSEAGETFEVQANSKTLPKINGIPVNLNPAKTYDSPYLSMMHGSNKAVIKYPGYEDVLLGF